MRTEKKRGIKQYVAGFLAAGAMIAMAIPVYAETTATAGRGMNKTNRLETLVEDGTISQSTYDSIASYITANQPEERNGLFSDAVSDGIIDQDTADKLQEYMQSRMEERKTAADGTAPTGKGRHADMWNNLLSEGIITQDDYDAIIASLPQRSADEDS